MTTTNEEAFAGWAILELMGHRRLAGWVSEATIGGASLLRLDIPDGKGEFSATQFYAPGAIYCITPTTTEVAMAVAARSHPEPVSRWELSKPEPIEHPDDAEWDD